MLHAGTRDCGFAGHDWVQELGAEVVEVLDTEMDPVRIVAASPDPKILEKGGRDGRKVIVASEYEHLAHRWIDGKGVEVSGPGRQTNRLRYRHSRSDSGNAMGRRTGRSRWTCRQTSGSEGWPAVTDGGAGSHNNCGKC
jgi:hypothetical protein